MILWLLLEALPFALIIIKEGRRSKRSCIVLIVVKSLNKGTASVFFCGAKQVQSSPHATTNYVPIKTKPKFAKIALISALSLVLVLLIAGGLWWFLGRSDKKEVNLFRNGLLNVSLDGKTWGYIDSKGNYVVNPQFDDAELFGENSLATVKSGDKWGYIDKTGKILINPQFDSTHNFYKDRIAAVKSGDKWGFIDKAGKFVINPIYDDFYMSGYYSDEYKFFEDGYAIVYVDEKLGVVNEKGEVIIPPLYENILYWYY